MGNISRDELMLFRYPRRQFAQLLALGCVPVATSACQSSPYRVQVPRQEPLGKAVISLQTTARKSPIRFISPRGRYAEKLRPQIAAGLIEHGFAIKKTTADLHLVVQVYEITTGGSARTARCDLLLEIYDQWPGDLAEIKKVSAELKPVFSMMVTAEEKIMTNGYPREQLAERAADQCVADLVDYLVRSKSQPMI
jgi:hypothetical protein